MYQTVSKAQADSKQTSSTVLATARHGLSVSEANTFVFTVNRYVSGYISVFGHTTSVTFLKQGQSVPYPPPADR